MKIFLLKAFIFFVSLALGLVILYSTLDQEQITLGDVRYIKTNNIARNSNNFDALIIGSSRVYDVGDIEDCNYKAFNYGFIQAVPADFPAFIAYAKKQQPIKKIILGLDFYGSSTKGLSDVSGHWKKSAEYVELAERTGTLNEIKSMFDFGRFKRLVNYKILGNNPFDRSAFEGKVHPKNTKWNKLFWPIYENAYDSYSYNDSLEVIYQQIKKSAGTTDLTVYITPESEPLIQMAQKKGLTNEYEKFLRTAVRVFGTVHNCMEVNEFTKDPGNFKDESHLTNKNLHEVLCVLLNSGDTMMGTTLTSSNIDSYIASKSYLEKGH